jgi:hypothetical protein
MATGLRIRDPELIKGLEVKIEEMVLAISNCTNDLETKILMARREQLKSFLVDLNHEGLTEQDDQYCADAILDALLPPRKFELDWAAAAVTATPPKPVDSAAASSAAAEPPVRTSGPGSASAAAGEPAPKRRWAVPKACSEGFIGQQASIKKDLMAF